MGERLLEANGLYNDNDLPDEYHHGRSEAELQDGIEPLKSTRADTVEKICKWFGLIPSDNNKDIVTTNHHLRNRNAVASWTEEDNWGSRNELAAGNRKRGKSASWQTSIWEQLAPSSEKQRYESSLINNTRVASELPVLMDEDEVDDYRSVATHNTSSKELDTKTISTTIWFTPNKPVEEPMGRSESYDSIQSLGYFTAASSLSTMGCEIDQNLEYLYDEEDCVTSYSNPTQKIEARMLAAFSEHERKINRSNEEWWMNDDGSCNSADLSSINTIDTYDDWDENEMKLIPQGYKCKTIYELLQHQEELKNNDILKQSNEKETCEEIESHDEVENELYHERTAFDNNEWIRTPDQLKPNETETTYYDEVEPIEVKDKTCEVEPIHEKINDQTAITIGIRRLISKCNAQQLFPWKNILKQFNEWVCFDRMGYEHRKVLCLICTRLHMIQRTGNALELTALLRRCSYPKRDVIRWSSAKNGGICPWKIFQLI